MGKRDKEGDYIVARSKAEVALGDYITKAKAIGMSEDDIRDEIDGLLDFEIN